MTKKMSFYQLTRIQKIPSTKQEVWSFISEPGNLKKITPPHMGFEIIGGGGVEKMYPGMIIMYKVSPLLKIKLKWVTEITHVNDGKYFVDEQRIGPYKMWHHQHLLEEIDGGVQMTDIVTYQPPYGFLGAIANALFIRKQLRNIFDFRNTALEKRFGKFNS